MRPARNKRDRIKKQNHLRTAPARRPQTTLPRHHESKAAAGMGTEDKSGNRPANVTGLLQKNRSGRIREEVTITIHVETAAPAVHRRRRDSNGCIAPHFLLS